MMNRLQRAFQRLRSWFRRADLDQELNAELDSHLDLAVEENLARGMTPEEARRAALIRLGGAEQARERHREARGLPAIDTFFQDLRYAARGIRKSPGFTAAAVMTLALGIAVNAVMFGMVSGFLLQTPPGRQPERVAVVTSVSPSEWFLPDIFPVSAPNFVRWRNSNNVFETMAAADEFRHASLTVKNETESIPSAAVSADFFNVLGVTAQEGRVFQPGDDQLGRDHVVILSHRLWDRKFGSDKSLIGRTIRVDREDYTVLGVMPANFRMMGFTPQLWTPLVINPSEQTAAAHKDRSLYLFARMKAGVTLEQSRAELKILGKRTEGDFPETEKGWGVAARTLLIS